MAKSKTKSKSDKVLVGMNIRVDQQQRLKELSEGTRVPMSVYVREGIEAILTKYEVVPS